MRRHPRHYHIRGRGESPDTGDDERLLLYCSRDSLEEQEIMTLDSTQVESMFYSCNPPVVF